MRGVIPPLAHTSSRNMIDYCLYTGGFCTAHVWLQSSRKALCDERYLFCVTVCSSGNWWRKLKSNKKATCAKFVLALLVGEGSSRRLWVVTPCSVVVGYHHFLTQHYTALYCAASMLFYILQILTQWKLHIILKDCCHTKIQDLTLCGANVAPTLEVLAAFILIYWW
jgi:hypothetical protein